METFVLYFCVYMCYMDVVIPSIFKHIFFRIYLCDCTIKHLLVNRYKGVFRTQLHILDGALCKYNKRFNPNLGGLFIVRFEVEGEEVG